MRATMAMLSLGLALLVASPTVALAQPSPPAEARKAALEREKLRQEIEKLEAETDNESGIRGFLATFAAPLTALVAVAGVLVTLMGQQAEQRRQREQRADESRRRLDERFAQVLGELGAESEAVQAGAAASLLTFLSDENRQFRRQVRLASLANLKVDHAPTIQRLILKVFEEAMRTDENVDPAELDFSSAKLDGARLEGLDLRNVDLRGTHLSNARLCDSDLSGAHGAKVILTEAVLSGPKTSLFNARMPEIHAVRARFNGVNLVNAHLEGGDLRGAQFKGARLQAAHLENAKLQEARFDGANIADAYFVGATFDETALASLRGAQNRERAHFSPEVKEQLRSGNEKRPDEGPKPNEEPQAQG